MMEKILPETIIAQYKMNHDFFSMSDFNNEFLYHTRYQLRRYCESLSEHRLADYLAELYEIEKPYIFGEIENNRDTMMLISCIMLIESVEDYIGEVFIRNLGGHYSIDSKAVIPCEWTLTKEKESKINQYKNWLFEVYSIGEDEEDFEIKDFYIDRRESVLREIFSEFEYQEIAYMYADVINDVYQYRLLGQCGEDQVNAQLYKTFLASIIANLFMGEYNYDFNEAERVYTRRFERAS